ncbi:MAG: AlwI family type II restriction endonuclease [Paludibacteraceae bacterium]|nr:AlwI family type II restriction endonuclease [Paludibacteraceae bacterium]
MAAYSRYIGNYEKIGYSSFVWKFGTTSFRTTKFNKMTEWQLRLLDEFWQKPEYSDYGWEKSYMFDGQDDIYWIKCRYYDWLVQNEFMDGGEPEDKKFKTAREKTSGLYDMGLINENHRLTAVGRKLLELAESETYSEMTPLNISKDSMLYLEQLLKLSSSDTGTVVRPFIVVLYLLSKLEYLSNDEFKYLMPLCTNQESTKYILEFIKELRRGRGSIDNVIVRILLSRSNYKLGLERFISNVFSKDLLLSVSMNRKSPERYDINYVPLYKQMHSVFMQKDDSQIIPLFQTITKFTNSNISIKWKSLLFDTPSTAAVKKEPKKHILSLPENVTCSEEKFKEFFFITMHLFKAKATLEDYLDLNRRYLGLTNCFIFEDSQVKLDIVPRQFFGKAIDALYQQAYTESEKLEECTSLSEICPELVFSESDIIDGINKDLGTHISTIEEAYSEIDRIKYQRFDKLVKEKFSDSQLIMLLDCFNRREDSTINQMVTDNADIPTIFEYILGIIWWKASHQKGKVLDYMKLSLDANLLPITHAAGGEADIVYEYPQCDSYPAHSVLLEATLADGTNQRRMEMEPVSRHVGNHILRTENSLSYGIFATTFLHINVISDFKSRKHTPYFDTQDEAKFIPGMKITPLDTDDLRNIIENGIKYEDLYNRFETAYQRADEYANPKQWYEELVKLC